MDIETMARAMFEALHARFSRVRDWMSHPNADGGQEHGRDTFRAMAQAVADVLEQKSPVEPVAVSAQDTGQMLNSAAPALEMQQQMLNPVPPLDRQQLVQEAATDEHP